MNFSYILKRDKELMSAKKFLVYSGDIKQERTTVQVLPWKDCAQISSNIFSSAKTQTS